MNARYRVALEGFGPFERQSLESYFKLTADQQPSFDPTATLHDGDLCVVDSDRPGLIDEVRRAGRLSRTVFVGSEPPQGAIVHLGRPINARQVARGLETLLLSMTCVADPFAPSHPPSPAPAKARMPSSGQAKPQKPRGASAGTDTPAAGAARPDAQLQHFPIDVMVLEESETAANVLATQLETFGCRVKVARHRDEALELLAQNRMRMVFSDVNTRSDDGLVLCQQIKSTPKGAPTVVLMSPRVTSSDRVRGQLAGADALLAKPVSPGDLLGVLRESSNRRRRAR